MKNITLLLILGCHVVLWLCQRHCHRANASLSGIISNPILILKDIILTPVLVGVVLVCLAVPNHPVLMRFEFGNCVGTIGAVLMWLGVVIKIWSYLSLTGGWSTGVRPMGRWFLKTGGPYSLVRHPVYVSYLISFCGVMLFTGSFSLFVLGALYFALNAIRARQEEENLSSEFGSTYLQYRQEVGGFVPLVFQYIAFGMVLLLNVVGMLTEVLWIAGIF